MKLSKSKSARHMLVQPAQSSIAERLNGKLMDRTAIAEHYFCVLLYDFHNKINTMHLLSIRSMVTGENYLLLASFYRFCLQSAAEDALS